MLSINSVHTEVIYTFQLAKRKLPSISIVILKVELTSVVASPVVCQWLDLCTQIDTSALVKCHSCMSTDSQATGCPINVMLKNWSSAVVAVVLFTIVTIWVKAIFPVHCTVSPNYVDALHHCFIILENSQQVIQRVHYLNLIAFRLTEL